MSGCSDALIHAEITDIAIISAVPPRAAPCAREWMLAELSAWVKLPGKQSCNRLELKAAETPASSPSPGCT